MRLLFVAHSLPPRARPLSNVGGMQRVAGELEAALRLHPAVELHSIVLRTSWRLTHLRTGPWLAALLVRIPRAVRRRGIDAVLFSSLVSAATAPFLRRRIGGARLAAVAHGRDATLPVTAYQRYVPVVLGALDRVFAVSRAVGAACAARGLPADRLRVVPNGVDPSRFRPPGDGKEARAAWRRTFGGDLPADAFLLLSVGRHVRRKGFAWFIRDVMPLLPERVHYRVVGDGPESGDIRAAIAARGLEGRVRLLGRVPDPSLEVAYRGADLFVMPNLAVPGDLEGFGVVLLEAGMCGLPILAAGVDGITDVVTEGQNGWLAPAGDAGAFAAAIRERLGGREALADVGHRAARFTAGRFAWASVAEQYVRALDETGSTSPAGQAAAAR